MDMENKEILLKNPVLESESNEDRVEPTPTEKHSPRFQRDIRWKRIATRLVWALALMVVGHVIFSLLPLPDSMRVGTLLKPILVRDTLFFILAGFLAQMVDGALGMGYGMISSVTLVSMGVSPVVASAAIHTSEVFTSGISGYSHYKFGNVNKKMFRHLVIPGVLGAISGALLLVFLGEKAGNWLRPLIAVYATFLGVRILMRVLYQPRQTSRKITRLGWLAGAGGFLDSFGGGGWGPIVTSTLMFKGRTPRYIIGSVSLTEFFITLASAVTFTLTIGSTHFQVLIGLLMGGVVAAPLAARLAGRLPVKTMLSAIGILVIIWGLRILWSVCAPYLPF